MLIVLLEYIDLFIQSDNMKQSLILRGCPFLYHSILPYYNMNIVANYSKYILPKFAPTMPSSCSLLLPSYFFQAKSFHPYES